MKIISKVKTSIKGVKIEPGIHDYNLDHNDPLTAHELYVLKFDQKVINFMEILPQEEDMNAEKEKKKSYAIQRMDKRNARIENAKKLKEQVQPEPVPKPEPEKVKEADVREPDKEVEGTGRDGDPDSGGGELSDKAKDASPKRSPLPKRRYTKNKTSKVRAKSSKK